MTQNLDKDFVTIKRIDLLKYNKEKCWTILCSNRKGQMDNDIAEAAKRAGYKTDEQFEYEIRIPKKG